MATSAMNTSPPVILIVEDNALARRMFRVALESEGYCVLEAEDGHTAIELTEQRQPNLILQNLMLPDVNGFELARALRSLSKAPILAVSGLLTRHEEAYVASLPQVVSGPCNRSPQRTA